MSMSDGDVSFWTFGKRVYESIIFLNEKIFAKLLEKCLQYDINIENEVKSRRKSVG